MYRSTGLLSEIIDASEKSIIREVLLALADEIGSTRPIGLQTTSRSNDQLIVALEDGRKLVVKRLLHDYLRSPNRLFLAQTLSEKLEQQEIQSPRYLPLPDDLITLGIRAYWRIKLPTLEDVWPHLGVASRRSALISAGALIRAIHDIRPQGSAENGQDIARRLQNDIDYRLLPASYAHWHGGVPVLKSLAALLPTFSRKINRLPERLLHGDLHMGNLLCDIRHQPVRCTGVLDLDDVSTGPGELDIATLEVNHGREFGRSLSTFDIGDILTGYARATDLIARRWFRAYRLLNMGYHAATSGLHEHAHSVARAAQEEVDGLVKLGPSISRHRSANFDHAPVALTI